MAAIVAVDKGVTVGAGIAVAASVVTGARVLVGKGTGVLGGNGVAVVPQAAINHAKNNKQRINKLVFFILDTYASDVCGVGLRKITVPSGGKVKLRE